MDVEWCLSNERLKGRWYVRLSILSRAELRGLVRHYKLERSVYEKLLNDIAAYCCRNSEVERSANELLAKSWAILL